jgi:hypothetical protein
MAKESLLEKMQRGLGGSEGGVVKDAAGNTLGEVKAQVVRDRMGHIIGEVGPPPEPQGPSAQELIQQGLEQKITDAEKAITPIAEAMALHGNAARLILDRIKVSPLGFESRREMKAKVADLKKKCDEGRKQIQELRKRAGMYSQRTPFLEDLDEFLGDLDRHFGLSVGSPAAGESAHDQITRGLEKLHGK